MRQRGTQHVTTAQIEQRAVSATFWSGAETIGRQGLQFVITMVLARLLTPEDYGTVALLAIFLGLAGVLINSGFSSALIQRQGVTAVDLSSVWLFNVVMALVAAAVLCAAAGGIAAFYGKPVLRPLTWLLSADLVIGALGAVHRVQLIKSLDFRRLCLTSVVALVVSGGLAIVLAYRGYGAWTLGWQALAFSVVSTGLLWAVSPWRVGREFSLESVRSLFRFGSFLLMSSVLDVLYSRLNTLVIGKFYSAKDLGHYARADNTSQIPGSLMSSVLSSVAFPVFARVQQDKALLRSGLRKAVLLAMLVNIPAMLGMIVAARPLVVVLFGEQWVPCVPYLQILCLAGLFWPLHTLNLNVLVAQGHSQRFFRLEVAKKTVSLALLGVTCFFGVTAIAWSAVVAGAICYVINAYYSGQLLGYGAGAQLLDLLPYAGVGAAMALAVAGLAWVLPGWPWLQLTGQVVAGALVYAGLCAVLRLPAWADAWSLAKTSPLGRRFAGNA